MSERPEGDQPPESAPERKAPAAAPPAPRWEYLEVTVDLDEKEWRDSSGRRRRLKKGQTADALAEVGGEGWELAGVWPVDGEEARLFFKRPVEEPEDGAAPADAVSPPRIILPPGEAPASDQAATVSGGGG